MKPIKTENDNRVNRPPNAWVENHCRKNEKHKVCRKIDSSFVFSCSQKLKQIFEKQKTRFSGKLMSRKPQWHRKLSLATLKCWPPTFSSFRVCEYVDHLHEHFVYPVKVVNNHYAPPKVDPQPRCGSKSAIFASHGSKVNVECFLFSKKWSFSF